MYDLMHDFAARPAPFSRYTAKVLWTRPHLARQMLKFHLDQQTDLASRRFEQIDGVVRWLDGQLKLEGKRLCDLGCGPGLYATRFAERGAEVTGVDFSAHSLAHGRGEAERAGRTIRYLQADYLNDPLPEGFDLITLIYCDLCVLSPEQRKTLLGRMRRMLAPGGRIVLDVMGMKSFREKRETTVVEDRLMGGFWAEGEYVGLQRTLLYPDDALSLDRYLIIEPDEQWQIFNWFQHFTPQRLVAELEGAGFEVETLVGSLNGEALRERSELIGVIAFVK